MGLAEPSEFHADGYVVPYLEVAAWPETGSGSSPPSTVAILFRCRVRLWRYVAYFICWHAAELAYILAILILSIPRPKLARLRFSAHQHNCNAGQAPRAGNTTPEQQF